MVRKAMIPLLARTAMVAILILSILMLATRLFGGILNSGNMVAFLAADNHYSIHILDTDRLAYANLEDVATLEFVVSPDGQAIAFKDLDYAGEAHGIFVMGTFGTDVRKIAQVRYVPEPLIWSPDSTHLAFWDSIPDPDAASPIPTHAIFLVDVRSGSQRQLTDDQNPYETLVWSPDGTQLAAISSEEQKPRIFILSTTDGKARLLTAFEQGNITDLTWSPDGQSLQFMWNILTSANTFSYAFYAIDADGQNQQIMSQGNVDYYGLDLLLNGYDAPPVVDSNLMITSGVSRSLDNRWIAYTVNLNPPPRNLLAGGNVVVSSDGIVIARTDGSDKHLLTTNFFDILSPVFIPR